MGPAPTVDLIYDEECPNIRAARSNLMRAFSRAGLEARWSEHGIGDADAPARVRGYGSPTILVDGTDVANAAPGAESCCRVYASNTGRPTGAPPVELIAGRLVDPAGTGDAGITGPEVGGKKSRLRSTLAILPGVGVAFMPKVICPLCWPAYAGVLSATGLTFLMEDRWLLPISAVFLTLALAALSWRAKSRRGYGPLLAGLGASAVILIGKFALGLDVLAYMGIAVLVAASVWNIWPRRAREPACPACVSDSHAAPK